MAKRTLKNLNKVFATLILIVLLIPLISGGAVYASAATAYSNVLDDLTKDPAFNIAEYPEIADDYNINVKQIAESTQGELLIYCYQPGGQTVNVKASSIVIARELDNDENLKFVSYSLKFQNSDGVFFKYSVDGFEIAGDTVRYYNISNILRPYEVGIDPPPADGQSITEVGNKVAQIWTAETDESGNVTYSVLTSEVLTIENKVVGYCAYDDGLNLGWAIMSGITKAYFVAFDTDRPIDKLKSADLIFFATKAHCTICLNSSHTQHSLFYDFHDPEIIDYGTGIFNDTPLTIKYTQKFSNVGGGNFRPANKYTWNRIRKTSDFIADNNNKDYVLVAGDELENTQWVLNFYEAQDKYKTNNFWLSFVPGISSLTGVADGDCELNNVYDVQILRLEFETEGKPYNLGVVDNVQTGDNDNPFNAPKEKSFWGKILAWLGALPWYGWVVLIFVAVTIAVGVVLLILKPFRSIAASCARRRERRAAPRKSKKRKRVKK